MDIFLLALVQGITEFLPISSSAHLMLLSAVKGLTPSTALKLAFHLGTLGAIVVYFWRDLWGYVQGLGNYLKNRTVTLAFKEGLYICAATVPAVVAGYGLHRLGGIFPENALSIGINSIIFGILLIYSDKMPEQRFEPSLKNSILIGLGQVIALIFPGASRSGSCLTVSRFLQFNRYQSVRFTFLLSIPTVLAGIVLLLNDPVVYTQTQIIHMAQAALFSFIIAFAVIRFILQILVQKGFYYFGIYRIILGLYLLLTI